MTDKSNKQHDKHYKESGFTKASYKQHDSFIDCGASISYADTDRSDFLCHRLGWQNQHCGRYEETGGDFNFSKHLFYIDAVAQSWIY